MITIRPAAERGRTRLGWLDGWHTFSFARYHDPRHMGFRALRVINDDVFGPGGGFGTHPHENMEILTYVLSGALEHRDTTGGGGVLRRGDVQRMSAGRGIAHSEQNASSTEPVHLLQIWVEPLARETDPSYEQRHFAEAEKRHRLRPIAAGDAREGALAWGADAVVYAGLLEPGDTVELPLAPGRHAWVQLAAGRLRLNDIELATGDGAAVSDEASLTLAAVEPSEVLVFDLG